MEPSTTIQLRKQLEAIKEFERKNAPSRLSYFGYWGELILGVVLLGRLIIIPIEQSQFIPFIPWVFFAFSIFLTCHGLYLLVRYNLDKRFRLLLEAVLSKDVGGAA